MNSTEAAHRDQVIEDVLWLLDTDSPENIATRLGYAKPANLDRALTRWGRHDLARRFRVSEQVAS